MNNISIDIYNLSGQKEAEIINLKRSIEDLEGENEEIRIKHKSRV